MEQAAKTMAPMADMDEVQRRGRASPAPEGAKPSWTSQMRYCLPAHLRSLKKWGPQTRNASEGPAKSTGEVVGGVPPGGWLAGCPSEWACE